MSKDKSRVGCASPSPQRITNKTFFGLITKRSTKVEPQQDEQQQVKDTREMEPVASSSHNTDKSFAKCQLGNSNDSNNNNKQNPNNNKNNDNSKIKADLLQNHISRRTKDMTNTKAKFNVHRHSSAMEAASGSLSLVNEMVLSQSPTNKIRSNSKNNSRHRSPHHNLLSHQFSLCCKADKKSMTPPVSVRYNSIPDVEHNLLLKREQSSLNWSLGTEQISLSPNSSVINVPSQTTMTTKTTAIASTLQTPQRCVNISPLALPNASSSKSAALFPTNIVESASAPESPVTAKTLLDMQPVAAHGSPSNLSALSAQSMNVTSSSIVSSIVPGAGPIRPLAISACRSRLRLKLFPPGMELPTTGKMKENDANDSITATSGMKRATTPQHMSSPNICTQRDVVEPDCRHYLNDYDVMPFMSHENLQIKKQSSGSGLARQSLLAAQMLSLIPTEKARERSMLEGRLGSLSLLGPAELERILPNKEVTIFMGTWNMNGQSPPKQMNDFVLPMTVENVPDIVAIGTQESSPDRFEWEVTLQETLGPSHVLFHSTALGTLHLAIYMRRDLIWYCSAPEDASFSVRTGSAFRTKGAVAISFCLFGTSMLYVTSHLTAHQQKVKERVSDVKRIIHALDLPKNLHLRHKNKDVTQNFDNVYWCGDLNFRLAEPREKLLAWIQNTKFPLPSHLPHGYMHTDQLSSVLADGAAFRGFMEANITFPPTYKYDPGTQHFDTSSKQRAPAYTDRILYKYRQTQGLAMRRQSAAPGLPFVECLLYDSVPSIKTSDHKPVWALFRTVIRAGTDSIPLAAGLFSRDIYLEGMKRRLNNQYTGSSAVCVLQ